MTVSGASDPKLHLVKPFSVSEHVHRERLVLRQVRSIDRLCILDPEDGIDNPFSS